MDHGHVVIVGSTNMDMITYVAGVPARGETVTGDSFALGFGGKGANQAVMARRLGADVSMVNTLGDDVFGDTTMANFENEGIDTTWISRVPGPSGVAPIWVEPDGGNRIIVVPGANALMTPEGAISALKGMAEYQVVVGQLEIPPRSHSRCFQPREERWCHNHLEPPPLPGTTPRFDSSQRLDCSQRNRICRTSSPRTSARKRRHHPGGGAGAWDEPAGHSGRKRSGRNCGQGNRSSDTSTQSRRA